MGKLIPNWSRPISTFMHLKTFFAPATTRMQPKVLKLGTYTMNRKDVPGHITCILIKVCVAWLMIPTAPSTEMEGK